MLMRTRNNVYIVNPWQGMADFRPFRRANIKVESLNSICLPKFLILFAYSSTVSDCICCFVNMSFADCHFKIAGWINFSANAALRCANVSFRSSGRFSSQSLAVKTSIAVAKRSLSPLSLPLYSKYVSSRRQNSVASYFGAPEKGSGRSVLSSAMLSLTGGTNNCKSGSSICAMKTFSFCSTKLSGCGYSDSLAEFPLAKT